VKEKKAKIFNFDRILFHKHPRVGVIKFRAAKSNGLIEKGGLKRVNFKQFITLKSTINK